MYMYIYIYIYICIYTYIYIYMEREIEREREREIHTYITIIMTLQPCSLAACYQHGPSGQHARWAEEGESYCRIHTYIYIHIMFFRDTGMLSLFCLCSASVLPAYYREGRKEGQRQNRGRYGQFSEFHVCFCGLDPGNLKFERVRTHKQHICFLGFETLNLRFCDLKL